MTDLDRRPLARLSCRTIHNCDSRSQADVPMRQAACFKTEGATDSGLYGHSLTHDNVSHALFETRSSGLDTREDGRFSSFTLYRVPYSVFPVP